MCLNTVHKIKRFWWKEGYKVFINADGKLLGQYYLSNKYPDGYPVNEWIKDDNGLMVEYNSDGDKYKSGFHFFKNREDAEWSTFGEDIVKKVLVKNIVATGDQAGKAGVAREMMILGE